MDECGAVLWTRATSLFTTHPAIIPASITESPQELLQLFDQTLSIMPEKPQDNPAGSSYRDKSPRNNLASALTQAVEKINPFAYTLVMDRRFDGYNITSFLKQYNNMIESRGSSRKHRLNQLEFNVSEDEWPRVKRYIEDLDRWDEVEA